MGMNIVLIGYRGSGKSAVGRELAGRLGWEFVDTDVLIEQRAGLTIREIFADRAEEGFRDLETRIVAEIAQRDRQVVSTGGGVLLRAENVAALKQNGRLVWLTAPAEVLWRRIIGDIRRLETRPQMDFAAGLVEVREALKQRNPVYRQVADVTVDTTDRSVANIVERILTRVHLQEDG